MIDYYFVYPNILCVCVGVWNNTVCGMLLHRGAEHAGLWAVPSLLGFAIRLTVYVCLTVTLVSGVVLFSLSLSACHSCAAG